MNDFTKEELRMILDDIDNDAITHRFGTPEFYRILRNKIQHMIDNYCEHATKSTNHTKLVCEDCGKEW